MNWLYFSCSFIFLWSTKKASGFTISTTTGATGDIVNANSTNVNSSATIVSEIDYETLSKHGISPEFADEFRLNLLKAIEALKDQDPLVDTGLRQNEFGMGGEGGGEEEEEDEETDATTPGPGAFGVLSGIFGIFGGLGSLNPSRIVQSTVNFFPPGRRMHAQMVVDSLIGYSPQRNMTIKTRRPATTTITPLEIMSNVTMESNATVVEAMNISTTMENDTSTMMAVIAKDVESNSATESLTTSTTEEGFINLSGLLNMTSTATPPTDEDDEVDVENKRRNTTPRSGSGSSGGGYKLIRPKPEIIMASKMNATVATAAGNETVLTPQPPTTSTTLTKREEKNDGWKKVVVA